MLTTKTVMSDSGWTLSGNEFDGQGGYRTLHQEFPSNYVRATESVDSIRTPNYWRKSQTMVKFVPRSGRVPTTPRMPQFFQPPKPSLKPRRQNQSNRSWARALHRYKLKVQRQEALTNGKRILYEARLKKYYIKMAKYQAFMKKVRDGVPRKVRVRVTSDSQWNPFEYSLTSDTGYRGSWRTNWRQWFYGTEIVGSKSRSGDITGCWSYNGSWPPIDLTSLEAQVLSSADSLALNRFHEKLSGESIHLGQVLAERAQTIGLLADAVKRCANFLRVFSVMGALRAVTYTINGISRRNTANDYLAFKFGVQPLIADVVGAAELVAHLVVDKFNDWNVRVATGATKSEENTVNIVRNGKTYVFTMRVSCKVRYVCKYTIDNIVTREMSKVGLINPAEILWELTPWSFVVDWLIPIGNYIRHLTNDTGLVYKQGCRTVTTTKVITMKLIHHEQDPKTIPKYWSSEQWGSEQVTRTTVVKTKRREILANPPKVQLPQFKNPLSITHVMEALALLNQKLFK